MGRQAALLMGLCCAACLPGPIRLLAQSRLPPPRPAAPLVQQAGWHGEAGQNIRELALHQQLDRVGAQWSPLRQSLELEGGCGQLSPCSNGGCRQRRYFAGGEATVMKLRFEDGAEEDAQSDVLDFDMQAGPRFWVGCETQRGSQLRATYWRHDNRTQPEPVDHFALQGNLKYMQVQAYSVDFELPQHLDFCPYLVTPSAGIRYASFEQEVVSLAPSDFRAKRFHGIGPTASVDLRQPWANGRLAWVAGLRGSLLAGEAKWSDTTGSENTDDIGTIVEMEVGLEWITCLPAIGDTHLRAVYEQQNWLNAGTQFDELPADGPSSVNVRQDDYDVAFMGFGFSLVLER